MNYHFENVFLAGCYKTCPFSRQPHQMLLHDPLTEPYTSPPLQYIAHKPFSVLYDYYYYPQQQYSTPPLSTPHHSPSSSEQWLSMMSQITPQTQITPPSCLQQQQQQYPCSDRSMFAEMHMRGTSSQMEFVYVPPLPLHLQQQEEDQPALYQDTGENQKRLLDTKLSFQGKNSVDGKTDPKELNEKSCDAADFSGISILAAAACDGNIVDDLVLSEASIATKHSSGGQNISWMSSQLPFLTEEKRLREAAEKAKTELSSTSQTEINLPFITADASGAKHLNITLITSKFEALVDDLIEWTRNPCKIFMVSSMFEKSESITRNDPFLEFEDEKVSDYLKG